MAVKGAIAKQEVMDKILQMFDGAFVYEKTIRIPTQENGQELQIKVALTAAKDIVTIGDDTAVPMRPVETAGVNQEMKNQATFAESLQPTEEEKKNVESFLKALGKL